MTLHPTLARQLARVGADITVPPEVESWSALLDRVSRSYRDADQDRYLIERSLAISSREMREMHETLAERAAEQAALLRIATAVAHGVPPATLFDTVSSEAARLIGVEAGRVIRLVEPDRCEIVGAWGVTGRLGRAGIIETILPLAAGLASTHALRTRQPALVSDYATSQDQYSGSLMRRSFRAGAAAPIMIGRRVWGVVSVVTTRDDGLQPGVEQRLAAFASLVSVSISNADRLGGLERRAMTDPLTGLFNHRAFHDRLADEVEAAHARRVGLCLAIFDIDRFKLVNDTHGHQTGDEVIAEVARRVSAVSRADATLGRIGGEEFGWILPGVDLATALSIAERARQAIRATPMGPGITVTISTGVGALSEGCTAVDLATRADRALYAAKRSGRDTIISETGETPAMGPAALDDEAEERRRALLALARTLSERSSPTRGHGERVADLAARTAQRLAWDPDPVSRLYEAALLHDVGKIAVTPEVLRRDSPLSDEDRAAIRVHPTVGAALVADVLDAEQATWIRHHHERWNGSGYPDGLCGDDIPAGAQIIGAAEAWDAMVSGRAYRPPLAPADAIAELERGSGHEFSAGVVAALTAVLAGDQVHLGTRARVRA